MTANYPGLLAALEAFSTFAAQNGATRDSANLDKLLERLQREKRSSKALDEEIFKHRGLTSIAVLKHLEKQDAADKERLTQEFSALRKALDHALIPPKRDAVPEHNVKGLAGNDEYTRVYGDPAGAALIAQGAIDVVQRFSAAVFRRDFQAAYALCATGIGVGKPLGRMVSELEKADRTYGGPAVACKIERIPHLLADDSARQRSPDSAGVWPRKTPPLSKRAIVGTFWFTDLARQMGRWVAFSVVEEPEGYRIAKWSQYLQ